jgi:hypothetical protein
MNSSGLAHEVGIGNCLGGAKTTVLTVVSLCYT